MLEETCNVVLRHVGPQNLDASSCPAFITLKNGKTTFGRHPHNDCRIDSSTYKNFISRWHCKIESSQQAGGDSVVFKIYDSSLNGTFVNDFRVSKDGCELKNGDKIIFGHLNGANISAGSFARQPKSVFQYVFQHADSHPVLSAKDKNYNNVWTNPCSKSVYKMDVSKLSTEYFGYSDVFDSSDLTSDDEG
ncbi:hypothetical protein Ahia01_000505300 [Argonauta hians]